MPPTRDDDNEAFDEALEDEANHEEQSEPKQSE
jgi:hypothetical protein